MLLVKSWRRHKSDCIRWQTALKPLLARQQTTMRQKYRIPSFLPQNYRLEPPGPLPLINQYLKAIKTFVFCCLVLLHKTLRSAGTKHPGALPSIAHHVKDNEGAVRELVFVLVRLGSPYGYTSPPPQQS